VAGVFRVNPGAARRRPREHHRLRQTRRMYLLQPCKSCDFRCSLGRGPGWQADQRTAGESRRSRSSRAHRPRGRTRGGGRPARGRTRAGRRAAPNLCVLGTPEIVRHELHRSRGRLHGHHRAHSPAPRARPRTAPAQRRPRQHRSRRDRLRLERRDGHLQPRHDPNQRTG
jgi:hypothetical protein